MRLYIKLSITDGQEARTERDQRMKEIEHETLQERSGKRRDEAVRARLVHGAGPAPTPHGAGKGGAGPGESSVPPRAQLLATLALVSTPAAAAPGGRDGAAVVIAPMRAAGRIRGQRGSGLEAGRGDRRGTWTHGAGLAAPVPAEDPVVDIRDMQVDYDAGAGAAALAPPVRWCPVVGCPQADPRGFRGWCSWPALRAHVDGHLSGALPGLRSLGGSRIIG